MRISFDFDGTLTDRIMKQLAKVLTKVDPNENVEVYVITSRARKDPRNHQILTVLKTLGIDEVVEVCYEDKVGWINTFAIDIHFDDDPHECESVFNKTNALPVLVGFDSLERIYNQMKATNGE